MNTLQKFIKENPDKPWDFGRFGLSINPMITIDFIKENIGKPWEWGSIGLSGNPCVTIDLVKEFPDKPWDWGSLACNPNITNAFANENIERLWGSLRKNL